MYKVYIVGSVAEIRDLMICELFHVDSKSTKVEAQIPRVHKTARKRKMFVIHCIALVVKIASSKIYTDDTCYN